jgi:hypothetical protein
MLLNYRQTKALKEFKEFRVRLDRLDLQDPLAHKGQRLPFLAQLGHRVPKVRKVLLALKAFQESKVQLDLRAIQVLLDQQVQLDRKVLLQPFQALLARLGHKGQLDRRAFKEQPPQFLDPRDPLDQQEPQVHKESLDLQDQQVLKDWWAQLDQQVQQEQRDPRVLKGLLERKDLRD